MRYGKSVGMMLLLLLGISLLAATIELNYCHNWTTTPPPNSPANYTKGGIACMYNSYVAIPGMALYLGAEWVKATF